MYVCVCVYMCVCLCICVCVCVYSGPPLVRLPLGNGKYSSIRGVANLFILKIIFNYKKYQLVKITIFSFLNITLKMRTARKIWG